MLDFTDMKHVFDFIKCSEDKKKLFELVKAKKYKVEGGKNDVCKAIRDLMDDSWEKGIEEGRELRKQNQ